MENEKKLTRSSNRMIAGVCAGIAEYFGFGSYLIKNSVYTGYILHCFRRSNHIYNPVDCHAGKKTFRRIRRPYESTFTLN